MTLKLINEQLEVQSHFVSLESIRTNAPAAALTAIASVGSDFSRIETPLPLSTIPITQEEIAAHSLIDRMKVPPFPTLSSPNLFMQIAANFLGSGLVTGGAEGPIKLDGSDFMSVLSVWDWILKSLNLDDQTVSPVEQNRIKNIHTGILQLKDYFIDCAQISEAKGNEKILQNITNKWASKIAALKSNEVIVLQGGWINIGGGSNHAQIYEFRRQENGAFEVNVFTSTHYSLAGVLFGESKTKIKPLVRYQDVPESHLLLNSDGKLRPVFIQSIIELTATSAWDTDRKVEEKAVVALFSYLEKYRVDVPASIQGAITPQRGGTCAPSVTKAWIRHHAGSLDLYKPLLFQAKLRLLIALYQQLKDVLSEDSINGVHARLVLSMITRNLLRRIGKMTLQAPLITPELARAAKATCFDVLSVILSNEKKIDAAHKGSLITFETALNDQQQLRQKAIPKFIIANAMSKVKFVQRITVREGLESKNLLNELKKLNLRLKNKTLPSSQIKLTNRIEIEELLDLIPLPDFSLEKAGKPWVERVTSHFWESMSVQEIESCLREIDSIAKYYEDSASALYPARLQATLIPLFVLTHYLALLIQKKQGIKEDLAKLENYSFPDFTFEAMGLPGIQYHDHRAHGRLTQALNYISTFQAGGKPNLFLEPFKTTIEKEVVTENKLRGPFWKALINEYPDCLEALLKYANTQFRDYSATEIEEIYQRELRRSNHDYHPPERIVNLPESTKLTAVMERLTSSYVQSDEVTNLPFAYIIPFRRLSYFLNAYYTDQEQSKMLNVQTRRTSPYSYIVSMSTGSDLSTNLNKKLSLDKAVTHFQKGNLDKVLYILKSPEADRSIDNTERRLDAEGSLLLKDQEPFIKRILRGMNEWTLAPYQLIEEFSREIDRLKSVENQGLFFTLFFQSPLKENTPLIGAGQILGEDGALRVNALKFCTKGLTYFQSVRKPSERFLGGTFFFQLSYFMAKNVYENALLESGERREFLLKEAHTLLPHKELNQWLLDRDFSDAQKAELHALRALYTTLTPVETVSDEGIRELLISWFFHNREPLFTSGAFGLLKDLKETTLPLYISRLINSKGGLKNLEKYMPFVLSALELESAAGREGDFESSYENFATIAFQSLNKPLRLTFDILGGTIFSPTGIIKRGDDAIRWVDNKDFVRLFGKNSLFTYQSLGENIYSFNHPRFGPFKIICSYSTGISGILIQRYFEGIPGEFQLTSSSKACLPKVLQDDHLLWISQNSEEGAPYGVITTLQDQKIKFSYSRNGEIKEWEPSRFTAGSNSKRLIVHSNLDKKMKFDQAGYVLLFFDESPLRMTFPRFNSEQGFPLCFERDLTVSSEQLIWTDNRQYYLSMQHPRGFLGNLENILWLEPVKGDGGIPPKILVPFAPIDQKESQLPATTLSLERIQDLKLNKTEGVESWGTCTFFTYTVENGEVVADTLNAKLFLAYLHLAQKRFDESAKILRSLRPTDDLDDVSQAILDLILTHKPGEDHPDSTAISLKALLILKNVWDLSAKKPIEDYCPLYLDNSDYRGLKKMTVKMLQSLNQLSKECCLSEKEQEVLIQFFLKRRLVDDSDSDNEILKARLNTLNRNTVNTLETKGKVEDFSPLRGEQLPALQLILNYSSYNYDQYLRQQNKGIPWLNKGSIPTTCMGASRNHFYENGLWLQYAVRVAHSSPLDIKALLFQLLLLSRQYPIKANPIIGHMIQILEDPRRSADLLTFNTSIPREQIQFIERLQSTYLDTINIGSIWRTLCGTSSKLSLPIDQTLSGKYPYELNQIFDRRERTRNAYGPTPQPLSVVGPKGVTHFNLLNELKSKAITSTEGKRSLPAIEPLVFDEGLLSGKEKEYRESLQKDIELLQEEIEVGRTQNFTMGNPFVSREAAEELSKRAAIERTASLERLSKTEEKLLRQLNTKASTPLEYLRSLALIGSKTDRELTHADAISCLLSGDKREYKRLNPNLTDSLIEEIAKLTLEVEELKAQAAQFGRIVDLSSKISKISSPEDLTRIYLCQKLASEFEANLDFSAFSNEMQVVLSVFAGESEILPHEKQKVLLKSMSERVGGGERFRDSIIQLIMGGGKTSVLATLLLYLAAQKENKLALFIVPASLFNTVRVNLSDSMMKAFSQPLYSLDFERDDLNEYKINQILKTLREAKEKRAPLIMKATAIQCLELELLSLAKTYAQGVNGGNIGLTERIFLLKAIVEEISSSSEALLDEVDLLLDALQETNFPSGEKTSLKKNRIALLGFVFEQLISQIHRIETMEGNPTIGNVTRLEWNKQNNMKRENFLQKVVPVVAALVADNYGPIREELGGFKASFIRYVTGSIHPVLQKFIDLDESALTREALREENVSEEAISDFTDMQEDLAFLRYLKGHRQSTIEKKQESAHEIALLRHLLLDVLPFTLGKKGNRNYGLKPDDVSGKVIPFITVGIPATTEFGYHWEEACYNFQLAASFTYTEEAIMEIASHYERVALYHVQRDNETFETTSEFEEFYDYFGVRLDEIHLPGVAKIAAEKIKKNPLLRLRLQRDLIERNVQVTEERLTSNGLDLVDMLSSARGMSGTPWNVEGYSESLARNYQPDKGTEGKIIETLIRRASEHSLYETEFNSIEKVLDSIIMHHPTPERIRGLIEAGGLFEPFGTNDLVARKIAEQLAHYQKINKASKNIKGVLFFHTEEKGKYPDTLYIWKLGADKPEFVGGSSIAALKAKNLSPEDYFIYFDERHTTGTDILQLPDVINIMTFDQGMILRLLEQAIMRERQFLTSQNILMVVEKGTRATLFKGGKSVTDLVLQAAKNQSVKKSRDMVKYFTQQIDHLFRSEAVKKILKDPLNTSVVIRYDPFISHKTEDAPYDTSGSLTFSTKTKAYLLEYLQRKQAAWKAQIGGDQTALEERVSSLAAWINEATCLPNEWSAPQNALGVEQEVHVQTEVQLKAEVDIQVETEIMQELQQYNTSTFPTILKEAELTHAHFQVILDFLFDDKTAPSDPLWGEIVPLPYQLSQYVYKSGSKTLPFQAIFSSNLMGTFNYFHTTVTPKILPVFHKLQRPCEQILVANSPKGLKWLFLSEHEAKAVRSYMQTANRPDLWLIAADGSQLVHIEGSPFFNPDDRALFDLVQINAFAGNIDWLDQHPIETQEWLSEGDRNLKIHFLKLRAANDIRQHKILVTSSLFTGQQMLRETGLSLFSKRIEREKVRQGNYKPASIEEAKNLAPRLVKKLHVDFVKYLSTSRQLNQLAPFQGGYITQEQVPLLPVEKVSLLVEGSQIYDADSKRYLLSKDQLKGLTEEQRHLIPFVNPEFYHSFEHEWQISSIPLEYVTYLSPAVWHLLSKDQLKQIRPVKKEELQQIGNLGRKISWLHGNTIGLLEGTLLKHLSKEQIKEIDQPLLISSLEELAKRSQGEVPNGRWSSWVSSLQVPHLRDAQLPFLKTAEQIAEVKPEKVPLLTEAQVPFITNLQVPYLSDEQVKGCPEALVPYVKKEQVGYLTNAQVPHFTSSQIKVCTREQFAYLTPQQIKEVDDTQLIWISKEQVKGLTKEQLLQLRATVDQALWETLRSGISSQQIGTFTTEAEIGLLTNEQIKEHLTRAQLLLLTRPETIQSIPKSLVSYLDDFQVLKIANDQIPFLIKEQLQFLHRNNPSEWPKIQGHLSTEQIHFYRTTDELRTLHFDSSLVNAFTNEQLDNICKDDDLKGKLLSCFTNSDIPLIRNPELIKLLSTEQMNLLTPDQVPLLTTPDLIKACPDNLLRHLTEEQLSHASLRQLLHLETEIDWKTIDKNISKEAFAEIKTEEVLAKFSSERISSYLQESQVSILKSPKTIKACPPDLLAKLDPKSQIPLISKKQLEKLNEPRLIRSVPWGKVKHLNREQLRKRTRGQTIRYFFGVTILGVVGTVVAAIAHVTLIPLIINRVNPKAGKRVYKVLHKEPKRMQRLFSTYLFRGR